MLEANLVAVGMGELKLARRGERLSALLGSCVAIGILWPKGGCCALAHCLLPEMPGQIQRVGARYVDQAVASLLLLLKIAEADKLELAVVVAGGASMLGAAGVSTSVGRLNIAAARAAVERHGLRVAHEDVGGRRGRCIEIDSGAYTYDVRHVERFYRELHDADN
jgi:chemotaxis protein CheD